MPTGRIIFNVTGLMWKPTVATAAANEVEKKSKYLNTPKNPRFTETLNQNQRRFIVWFSLSDIFNPVKKSNNVEKISKNKNLQSQQE